MEVVQVVVVFKCFELCFSWSLEDVSSFIQNSPAGVPGVPDLTGELLTGAALQVFLGAQVAEKQGQLPTTQHLKKQYRTFFFHSYGCRLQKNSKTSDK